MHAVAVWIKIKEMTVIGGCSSYSTSSFIFVVMRSLCSCSVGEEEGQHDSDSGLCSLTRLPLCIFLIDVCKLVQRGRRSELQIQLKKTACLFTASSLHACHSLFACSIQQERERIDNISTFSRYVADSSPCAAWKKKRDGKTVREDHEKLKIAGKLIVIVW